MKRSLQAVLIWLACVLPTSSALGVFDCPPYQPLTSEKTNVEVTGKVEGLKAFIGGAELGGKVQMESEAVYTDTGGDTDIKLIKYTILVMLCKSVRDDPSLSASDRRAALMQVVAIIQPGAPPAAGAPSDDFTMQLDGTRWRVAAYDADGNLGAFDPSLPWEFLPNKTVGVREHWDGTWDRNARNNITIKLRDKIGQTDEFRVDFVSPSDFFAFKDGKRYRHGEKM